MTPQRAAELALIAVAAVWGLTFAMVQDAVAELPVLAFLAYRFLAAAALVAPFARADKGDSPLSPPADKGDCPLSPARSGLVVDGVLMGAALTTGYVLQTFALEHTTASNVGFITGLVVVIAPLLAGADRIALGAAVVAAIGLALLSGVGGDMRPLGDGLALGCAFAFALHILATARGVARHDVVRLLVVQLGVCGVVCLVAAAATGDLEVPRGATVWVALVVTAVFASAIAFFVQSYAQRHASPARTALILASEPAFAGLFGWLLAGDRLTALGWVGAGLIVVAIVTVDLVPRLRPPRPLPEA